MKERFERLMEGRPMRGQVSFGTFHSVFFRILKLAYQYDASDIIREDQKLRLIRELTAKEAQALYDAAWRDIRAENVLPVDGDYAWLGVEITLFRDGDSRTISSTKSSYKELTQALLDLGIPAEDIGEINID